jgi:1-deoxy-D-xylulose-5-phosphate reductoisomerase
MRAVSLVGSTGSIGTQALEVIARAPDDFRVVALGANSSVTTLAEQANRFHPDVVGIVDASLAETLESLVPRETEVISGPDVLSNLARIGDVVVNAVVGFAGLSVTVEALRSGRRLALANKESLIAGAPVVQRARATPGAEIVPVDSEHCAIHQCLGMQRHVSFESLTGDGPARPSEVARLIVTASGGPFRGRAHGDLRSVTIEDALAHPTWKMGPKITIDSSTLMNKGLEVIEAHELFGVGYDEIEVVVHPQSIIHSMVEFCDGATVAQLSNPDMRLPIGYALAYPDRFSHPFGAIDWLALRQLDFDVPDLQAFRCLGLAYAAGREGGDTPAWLNAANEVAVGAFLRGHISWLAIAEVVERTLEAHIRGELTSVQDVLAADEEARRVAKQVVAALDKAA